MAGTGLVAKEESQVMRYLRAVGPKKLDKELGFQRFSTSFNEFQELSINYLLFVHFFNVGHFFQGFAWFSSWFSVISASDTCLGQVFPCGFGRWSPGAAGRSHQEGGVDGRQVAGLTI